MKRCFDIFAALTASLILLPFSILIAVAITLESKGGFIYKQKRVGKDNADFNLLKFRTMRINSDKNGLLTVGDNDNRITKIGYFLRKYKLDELPQLLNILVGDMSIVGPRPEVRKYVNLYNQEQLKVLSVRPGLTDYASLTYISESELLAESTNPEETYIKDIMPHKIKLGLQYINNQSLAEDTRIIFKTLFSIIKK